MLRGGDAPEGYVGKIEFDRNRVTARSVSSAAEPDTVFEETRYFRYKIASK